MTDSASVETKTLEAKCFCGSVHFTVDVPLSSLPFPVHLCHCSICRFTTGAPCVFHTPLGASKANFIAPSSEANITSYVAKGAVSRQEFCSTCGCHIKCAGDGDHWVGSTSIFVDNGPDIFRINRNIYSKSTKDGGIASMLTNVGGRDMVEWEPPADSPRAKLVESQPEVGEDGQERLRAQCHCGGVSFTFGRPTQEMLDDEFTAGFVSPLDKKKWLALLDVCTDCRLVAGTNVIGWTFLPLSICEPPIKADLKIGTSKTYATSPGVLRSFCGTCGATVFYSNDERRPDEKRQIVDLATGILRAPKGVMADDWFTWRTTLAWRSSGITYDKEFVEALQEGMSKRAIEMYGKELTFNVG